MKDQIDKVRASAAALGKTSAEWDRTFGAPVMDTCADVRSSSPTSGGRLVGRAPEGSDQADAARVIAWAREQPRRPASTAFTAGHERQAAYWIEWAEHAERERHADALRCALEALDYCIEDSAELLHERTAQWGQYRKDRQAAMAATLERHRAVAERLRAMLGGW